MCQVCSDNTDDNKQMILESCQQQLLFTNWFIKKSVYSIERHH